MKQTLLPSLLAIFCALATLLLSPPDKPGERAGLKSAAAQQVHLPMVGRQFPTFGLELQGGPVLDWTGEDLEFSPALGPRLRFGLHHIVGRNLSMNAEVAIGATYFAPHPMAPEGAGTAQTRLDWRLSMLARRFQLGPTSGWTYGGGIDYRQAHLRDGRLLQFGVGLRAGRFLWTDEERFLIVELGVHAPIWEGLNIADFDAETIQEVPAEWSHPSLSLGIQWAF